MSLREDGCSALPLAYGPQCTSASGLVGSDSTMITYKISEIISNTNIECMGLGYYRDRFCAFAPKWGWYPLGVLKEGDEATIYWGANAARPAIKCKGEPLYSGIKWEWKSQTPKDWGCCGSFAYNPTRDLCCSRDPYSAPMPCWDGKKTGKTCENCWQNENL